MACISLRFMDELTHSRAVFSEPALHSPAPAEGWHWQDDYEHGEPTPDVPGMEKFHLWLAGLEKTGKQQGEALVFELACTM